MVQPSGGASKQEAAILELTEELIKLIESTQTRLDSSFERSSQPTAEGEGRPTIPNVLDEISDNLRLAIARVQKMHEFIVHAVIHKVHNI